MNLGGPTSGMPMESQDATRLVQLLSKASEVRKAIKLAEDSASHRPGDADVGAMLHEVHSTLTQVDSIVEALTFYERTVPFHILQRLTGRMPAAWTWVDHAALSGPGAMTYLTSDVRRQLQLSWDRCVTLNVSLAGREPRAYRAVTGEFAVDLTSLTSSRWAEIVTVLRNWQLYFHRDVGAAVRRVRNTEPDTGDDELPGLRSELSIVLGEVDELKRKLNVPSDAML